MKKIEFIIPFFPISINSALTVQRYNRSRRILTKEARQFKENVTRVCEDEFDLLWKFVKEIKDNEILKVEYLFCSRWINKNGTNKKKDVANFEKLLTDSIMGCMKIDDKMIWNIRMIKLHSETKEFVLVKIFKDSIEKYIEQ